MIESQGTSRLMYRALHVIVDECYFERVGGANPSNTETEHNYTYQNAQDRHMQIYDKLRPRFSQGQANATLYRASCRACLPTTKHLQRTIRPEQDPPAVLSTMEVVNTPRQHSRAIDAGFLIA